MPKCLVRVADAKFLVQLLDMDGRLIRGEAVEYPNDESKYFKQIAKIKSRLSEEIMRISEIVGKSV